MVHTRLGKYEEVEEMYGDTLQLWRKVQGEEHPETLTSMNNLGSALIDQERYKDVENMHRETSQLRRKVLVEGHPSTLTSVHNLAYLLALHSRFVQAAILYQRALAEYQRILGPDHPPPSPTRACVEQYPSIRNSRVNEN